MGGGGDLEVAAFPARDDGVSKIQLQISLSTADPLTMVLLAQPVLQVVVDVKVRASADLSFLGLTFESSSVLSKVCGFEVQIGTQRVGHARCATSLADLVIPSVDDETTTTELVHMSPAELAAATRRKNSGLSAAMAISAVLALTLLACGLLQLRRGVREVGSSCEGEVDSV